MYQIINSTSIQHLPSGVVFPTEPGNMDYEAYLPWVASGNAPLPAEHPTLDERRNAAWELIKSERGRRENGGVQAGGHWFQTDSDSRIKMLRLEAKAVAALAAGGAAADVLTVAGQPIQWKTTENGLVPMTVDLAQGIMLAIELLDALAYTRAEVLRAQVMASGEPEAIDITTGWPPVYGG